MLTIGTGSGMVTSSPAGIACGADCTESYPAGTVVTLTAAANSGATFVRWRGHADCADGQVTLSVAKTCAAVFTTISLPQLEDGRAHSTIAQLEPFREERDHPQTSPAPSH